MKKLFLLLLFVTSFNVAIAQNVFNEDDLIGKWVANQSNPRDFISLKEFYFTDYCYQKNTDKIVRNSYEIKESSKYEICDYFISSSNRLHINFGTACRVYKIISLTSDRMVLSYTYKYDEKWPFYDPDHPIENVEVEFYKEEDVSAINEITDETTDSDNIYDLKGQLLENEPDSGVYIQNGKKYVKK